MQDLDNWLPRFLKNNKYFFYPFPSASKYRKVEIKVYFVQPTYTKATFYFP